jgi:hypothetical protein
MSKEKENSRFLQKKVTPLLLILVLILLQLETLISRQHEEEDLLSQAELRVAELTKEVDSLRHWKVTTPSPSLTLTRSTGGVREWSRAAGAGEASEEDQGGQATDRTHSRDRLHQTQRDH